MCRKLIFGGTTEGRQIAEYCEEKHIRAEISVATEYGAKLLSCGEFVSIMTGRLDYEQMNNLINTKKYDIVIDATHPYAEEATKNIRKAAENNNIPYYRLVRQNSGAKYGISVKTMQELIERLNSMDGIILNTLGSKEIDELIAVSGYHDRIWTRMLPSPEAAEECVKKGFDRRKLILEKGPFSAEQNIQHIIKSGADILITKESGDLGGYNEKIEASEHTGITMITLSRPYETGYSFDEIIKILEKSR